MKDQAKVKTFTKLSKSIGNHQITNSIYIYIFFGFAINNKLVRETRWHTETNETQIQPFLIWSTMNLASVNPNRRLLKNGSWVVQVKIGRWVCNIGAAY